MRYFLSTLLLLTLSSCFQNGGIPNSAPYKPTNPREEESFKNATKVILPLDVKKVTVPINNKLVVWTGIVKKLDIYPKDDETIADIYLEHRYYDFIEDFSIQQEKMFVSPFGEGEYILRQKMNKKIPTEEIKKELPKIIFKECFLITYGKVEKIENGIPILQYENLKIVFPENYATNIFSYKFQRDKNNKLVLDENGEPELSEFKQLKTAREGRNQLGSRLENSIK